MIDLSEIRGRDNGDNIYWQLELRITLLFGEDRAAADREEINLVAAAIQRIRRLPVNDFASLDPTERG